MKPRIAIALHKEVEMKAIIAILSVALVAFGGSAIHLWRKLDTNRHQLADLRAQQVATAAAVRQAVTIAPSPSLPLAEPSAAAPAATPTALSNADSLRVALASAQTPEAIAGYNVFLRGQMPTKYPDVGKVLGLSPDEVERLYDLLIEQRFQLYGPDAPMDAGSLARVEQSQKDERRSLLGSKYSKWQEYTTELPTRRQLKDLDAVLGAAGAPLSDAQRNSLIQAVAAVDRSKRQERAAIGQESSLTHFAPDANQKVLDAAAAHLTPQQLESYSQMLERESSRETMLRDMLRERGVQK